MKDVSEIQRRIAVIIDHQSVYIGGPSRMAMKKAKEILDDLAHEKKTNYYIIPDLWGIA
jgi:hypothetical protein